MRWLHTYKFHYTSFKLHFERNVKHGSLRTINKKTSLKYQEQSGHILISIMSEIDHLTKLFCTSLLSATQISLHCQGHIFRQFALPYFILLYHFLLFAIVFSVQIQFSTLIVVQGLGAWGRELTNWQSDLIENIVNPTLAWAFNLTSSLTHWRPINPLLNPKAFLFCGQCATHCHKSPSA